MKKHFRIVLTVCVLFAAIILILAACNKQSGGDRSDDIVVTDVPTMRPTEVPMRDISGDTPLADTVVYANRMANEVQAYFSNPDRSAFTGVNSISKFELELFKTGGRGISYFADYYGNKYFENSMDAYVKDTGGNIWTDRLSPVKGRQNTYRIGYYYTEVHLMDLKLGCSVPELSDSVEFVEIGDLTGGWNANMCEAEGSADGLRITVTDSTDPYVGQRLKSKVDENNAGVLRVTMVSDNVTRGYVYYFDAETGGFNAEQNSAFEIIADGKEHSYLVPLSALKGPLAGIRFDIDGQVGESVLIKKIESGGFDSMDIRTDRVYHLYSDKLHQAYRFVAASAVENIKECGIEWKVKKDTVDAFAVKDAGGVHSDFSFDPATVEYVAFHIVDNGVVGIIIPAEGSGSNRVTVEETNGYYVVRQYTDALASLKKGKDHTVGNRLYCDKNSDFEAIDKEAYLERHPLTDIVIEETDSKAKFKGYDPLRGCYTVSKNGTDFSTAYSKKNRNKYYTSTVSIDGDDRDRNIYMRFAGANGCLECAALLDKNNMLVPVPMEVCKNFQGEIEEPFYDPKDTQYGDSFFPVVVKAGSNVQFTELHLYQSWGRHFLKQISSIQFFIGYYHLSTGTTESNCIAPYFVYGKDGWTLPDFRGCSGVMWSSQPQFTSIGIHKWLSYVNGDGKKLQSEFTGADIRSSGPTYADMDYNYISDCGSYKFTLRHVEFPQTDENRTYYTISVEFLKALTIDDAVNKFNLLHFNSRDTNFTKFMYLDKNGAQQIIDLPTSGKKSEIYDLNKGSFYYAIYGGEGKSGTDIMNYALILKAANVTVGGNKWDGNFKVRYHFDGKLDNLYLTLDQDKLSFKKGDTITLDVILLPFGEKPDKAQDHAPVVYEDSVLHPLTVTAQQGTVIADTYIPKIQAKNNAAEFTLTGSRDANTVVISGFDVLARPDIFKWNGTDWELYEYNVKDYDGYQVAMAPDGTYTYSFVYDQPAPSDTLRFKIEVKK